MIPMPAGTQISTMDRPGGLTLTACKWSHQGPMAASKFITAVFPTECNMHREIIGPE
jgi:hypothetical protein